MKRRFCERCCQHLSQNGLFILGRISNDFAKYLTDSLHYFAKYFQTTRRNDSCPESGEISRFCEICYQHLSQNPEISPDVRNACYQAMFRDFAKYVTNIFRKIPKYRLISGMPVIRRDFGILRNMLPTYFAKSWNARWYQECLSSGEISGFCEICHQHISQNPEMSPGIRNVCYQAVFHDFAKYVGDILRKIVVRQ